MDFSLQVDQQSFDEVKKKLRRATDLTHTRRILNRAGAQALTVMLMRTKRGVFLEGSKSPAVYSPGHARRRKKLGLETSKVDLFMGENSMLEAMNSAVGTSAREAKISVGYLDGAEAKAVEIAGYLNNEGAGKNKVLYKHVGLTDDELETIVTSLQKDILKNILDRMNK